MMFGRMLTPSSAAIYAEARQMLDWNARNPFCAQCGQPTMSVNGGFKRTCPPKDASRLKNTGNALPSSLEKPVADESERPPCATRKGVSNLSFPRTDPTVIMAVVNHAGDRLLLGRQKRWPPYWFSTLAGFAEPAESIEEAVRREVYEEAGVHVGRVVIHSTQHTAMAIPSQLDDWRCRTGSSRRRDYRSGQRPGAGRCEVVRL